MKRISTVTSADNNNTRTALDSTRQGRNQGVFEHPPKFPAKIWQPSLKLSTESKRYVGVFDSCKFQLTNDAITDKSKLMSCKPTDYMDSGIPRVIHC